MMRSFPRARWLALSTIVALSFLSGGWLLRPAPAAGGGVYQQARLFEHVVTAINQHYIDSLGEGTLYQQAATSLVKSLGDPYAELLVNESYREYRRQMTGTEVDFDLEHGPTESGYRLATSLGFGPGDEVLSIDGRSTEGWSARRIEEALREGRGPSVTVVVRPRGAAQPVVRRLTRTAVHVPAASPGVLLDGRVGYISLRRMSEGAGEELRTAVDSLVSKGMRSLVLDLRSNPGGLIREGVEVAGLFLEDGDTVATSIGRTTRSVKTYLAHDPGRWDSLRVVLLVNRGTASSAELIAGALQDHDRAAVIGTATYGKGVLQTTYPLGDEVAIKLTTARWFTPSGRSVQRPPVDAVGGQGNRTPALTPEVRRTAAGRPVPDASGILPDLTIRASLRSEGERTLSRALGEEFDRFRSAVVAYAADLRARREVTDEAFQVTPAMRDSLFHRLDDDGLALDRATYDSAATYVNEQLGNEIARELFGTESVVRRQAKADRQLQAALRLLRAGGSQQDILTAAVAGQASGRIR
ncbi:MAG TPA: S41 family peptidase [Gemmatimonadales bacterium]|nr:S41 family peptidase [Gemmatimonadales bacterium]